MTGEGSVCPTCRGSKQVIEAVCDDSLYCPVRECPTCDGDGVMSTPPPATPAEKDWQGRPVPPGEPGDAAVTVWEVDPHPGDGDKGSVLVIRPWQGMLSYVRTQLERWLETFDEDELREGVTLTFRLADVRKDELPGEG